MSNIHSALSRLDPANDAQWTADGAPLMEAIKELTGDENVTRKQVIDAMPTFNRELAEKAIAAQEAEVVPPVDPENSSVDPAPVDPENSSISPYQEEYDLISKNLENLIVKRDAINGKITKLAQRQAQLDPYVAKSTDYNHQRDMENRKAYIKKQNEIRLARHTKHGKILSALGVETGSASPIDQAFGRKTKRGLQRPVR